MIAIYIDREYAGKLSPMHQTMFLVKLCIEIEQTQTGLTHSIFFAELLYFNNFLIITTTSE